MPIKIPEREYRAFGGAYTFENQSDEKHLILRGTPVVFETPTVLFEYDGIKYYEQIERGAFDKADMSDFILNVNHELAPYARSKNGTLKYTIGERLDIEAILDAEDERHRQLYRDVSSGLIDKMSFSFTIAEQSYDEEKRLRKIIRVKKLYDVSAVTFPAYEQTSISARSFFEEEYKKEVAHLEQEQRRKKLILRTFT